MPRTKNDIRVHDYIILEQQLQGAIKTEEKKMSDICKILDVRSETTARKLIREPNLLKVEQLNRLIATLHLNVETIRPITIFKKPPRL